MVVCAASLASADARKPIHVAYDQAHLDLDKHVLQFKPSRPVVEAKLTVIGEDGTELAKETVSFEKEPGEWWPVSWTPKSGVKVMMLKLRVQAADGIATNVELIPWSVTIEHEDVKFRSDSAEIDEAERAKLDASVAKIEGVVKVASPHMKLTLYVAGHTDTVGPGDKNRKLSLARATAIGKYFASKKVDVPIVVAGFGEDVPKVKTADEVDNADNRRADYVIGPQGATPPFGGAYAKAKAEWKPLPK